MIKSNAHYFKISQNILEPHLDENYFVIEKNSEMPNYISTIRKIKEVLITIKKLKESKEKTDILERYYKKLFDVFNSQFANCSELGCFVNACDTTRDLVQKDYEVFKKITDLFIAKRELNDKIPENWVQAILDSNSSRKKGELGEKKLMLILKKKSYKEINNWEEFEKNKKVIARFSKNIFSTEGIRQKLKLKIATKKQDKRLDLLIKRNERIFLLEAKHSNVGGGEQDKQISELIEILSLGKERDNIHYISFLDGTYSNAILGTISKRAKKMKKQRKEIEKFLKKNPQNFWVNTAGFVELIKDLG